MTWDLTPEEEFNPRLLPPVAMDYPSPLPEAEVPYVVGVPEMNRWYHGGYAGPLVPPPSSPEVIPTFDRPLINAWGKMPSEYQADYPSSFWPEVVDSYEAMFNRPPAATTQQRDWPGSDVRVDSYTYAPRQKVPNWRERELSGGDLGEWYSTTGGLVALTVGVGLLSFLGARAYLRTEKGQSLLRR